LFSGLSFAVPDTSGTSPAALKSFGTVWRLSGKVTASGKGSTQARELKEGDDVYVGELLKASSSGEAVLKTADKGFIAVRSNAEFLAESFSAEGRPSDNFTIRIFTGSLRVISGWISHINRTGGRIVTPSATIGVRGTDHEPYVLSAELAAATSNKEGTYDKVNRGGTILQVGDKTLDIDPGKVGFVRAQGKNVETRALMTLLLPVLLDKVPNFYVPGKFDAELDQHSLTADKDSLLALEHKRSVSVGPHSKGCNPGNIANAWLNQLDTAIKRKNASAIISLFAPESTVRAIVHDSSGKTTSVDLGRDELAQSTVEAMKGLKNYKQHRVTTDAKLVDSTSEVVCNHISLKSVVTEQGLQSGKPFRFESLEEYELELREGKWLSVKAQTTQQ
jgi:hypothetical protein